MTTVITTFAGHIYVYVNSSARTAHMTEQAYKASRSPRLATSQETAMPCHHSSQHASATQTALAADLPPTNPAHARPAVCIALPHICNPNYVSNGVFLLSSKRIKFHSAAKERSPALAPGRLITHKPGLRGLMSGSVLLYYTKWHTACRICSSLLWSLWGLFA